MPTRNQEATRFYSDRQESAITEFLGWKRTPASGSRPFVKGDIVSDEYVGECKTHVSPREDIIFNLLDWTKICTEANGSIKRPVLFTDDGTQKVIHTFCMMHSKFADGIHIIENSAMNLCSISATRIRFNVATVNTVIRDTSAIHIRLDASDVVIMHIKAFKRLIDGDFYD